MLLAAVLMGKQMVLVDNVTKDAGTFYLPLAKAVHDGGSGFHPIIPPLYPILTGWLSTLCVGAEDPQILAGRLISGASTLVVIGLMYALGKTLYGPRVGGAAAVLTAANPYISQLAASVGPAMLYAGLLTAMALTLVRQLQRPTAAKTAAVAALAALAALARSEGIVMPAVALATVAAGLWRPPPRRARRIAGRFLLAVLVIGAIWTPRLAQMHRRTGLAVLDIRIRKYLPGVSLSEPRRFSRPPGVIGEIRPGPSGRIRTADHRIEEAVETLTMVVGPATWPLAALWLGRRKRLRTVVPGRPAAHGLLATIFAAQVLAVAPVMLNSRYVGAVTPLAQLWAALGLVTAAEAMRRTKGPLRRLGASMRWQWAAVALLAAGLSTWSVLKGNNTVRQRANAMVGRRAIERSGPGSAMLASDPRPIYYAQARWVRLCIARTSGHKLLPAALLAICRTHALDWIVIRDEEQWCPWLLAALQGRSLPTGILAARAEHAYMSNGRRKVRGAYLIDARRLAAYLQSRQRAAKAP